MKKKALLILSCILIAVLVFTIAAPQHTEAATFKPAKTYYLDSTANNKKYGVTTEELLSNFTITITKVKSSKAEILKVKKTNGIYQLYPLKNGAVKLTVTYKNANGASKTFSSTVRVKTYANPVKKFAVGSADFTSRFKKNNSCQYNIKTEQTVKGKLTVTAARGWKVIKIRKYDYYKSKWSTLTNGKKYTFKCGSDRLVVTLKYTKTGYIRTLTVNELG